MANLMKFTDSQVIAIINHDKRLHLSYSNNNIDPSRSHLNYSIPVNCAGLSAKEYYKKILDCSYIYGRNTKMGKNAVTAASWTITLPKELVPFPEKQQKFFEAVTDFITNRYGGYTLLAEVHNDEGHPKNPAHPNAAEWIGGLPHIHILFMPVVPINHDYIHFRTVKTKKSVKLSSGRYEFVQHFKLDESGNKIPVKNYAKSSDQYDIKLAADQMLNKMELQKFHKDLQSYLIKNNIDGAVYTGITAGTNYTIKDMKELTNRTGLTLDQVRTVMPSNNSLQSIVIQAEKLEALTQLIQEKDMTISALQNQVKLLTEKLNTLQLHTSEKVQSAPQGWGSSGWDEHTEKKYDNAIHFEEE